MQRKFYVGAYGVSWIYILTQKEILKVKTFNFYPALLIIFLILSIPFVFPTFYQELFVRIIIILISFIYPILMIVYLDDKAKRLRRQFSKMDEEEIVRSEKIEKRIEYNCISESNLKQGKILELILHYDGEEIKIWFDDVSYKELKEFLSSKFSKY